MGIPNWLGHGARVDWTAPSAGWFPASLLPGTSCVFLPIPEYAFLSSRFSISSAATPSFKSGSFRAQGLYFIEGRFALYLQPDASSASGDFGQRYYRFGLIPSLRHRSAIRASPRSPSSTIRIRACGEYRRRVWRCMSLTAFSALSLWSFLFCLIVVLSG